MKLTVLRLSHTEEDLAEENPSQRETQDLWKAILYWGWVLWTNCSAMWSSTISDWPPTWLLLWTWFVKCHHHQIANNVVGTTVMYNMYISWTVTNDNYHQLIIGAKNCFLHFFPLKSDDHQNLQKMIRMKIRWL